MRRLVFCALGTLGAVGVLASGGAMDAAGATFVFPGNLAFDAGLATGSQTLNGVTLQADANQGVLNGSSTSFGVNSAGGLDEPSKLDGDAGAEAIAFSFPGQTVYVNQVVLSAMGGADAGVTTFAGGAP